MTPNTDLSLSRIITHTGIVYRTPATCIARVASAPTPSVGISRAGPLIDPQRGEHPFGSTGR